MADIVSDLASKCGISAEQAKQGLGSVLAFFKDKLPAESFSKLSAAVPNSDNLVAAAQNVKADVKEASGGVLGAISGLASKLFGGGGGASELLSKFSAMGFSAEQLQGFLPKVMEFFKSKLPPDVTKQISGLIPVPEEAAAGKN